MKHLEVFVVEDHKDTRELLAMYLQEISHTIHSVTSVAEALRKLPGADYDVLTSDIGLPDSTG